MNKSPITNSRVSNSIQNTIFGMVSYLIILIATLFSRKIFADILGLEFLGLNNYFLSIVTMLSLTEMGIGTAMLFFLYEPMSIGNREIIKSLIQYYKHIYYTVGIIITVLGGIVTIFIGKFVDSSLPIFRIRVYFVLFFLGTSVTYILAHKKNLLYADQKSGIISITRTISKVTVIILQTIVLVITGSFSLFLILIILGNIADNLFCSIIVDRLYPYIKDKNIVPINKEFKRKLIKKVIPIFIYNIADYCVSSAPTIVISIVSLLSSGLYSNYILITTTLRAILGSIFASFTYSFGNLAVSESDKKCYDVFLKIDFLAYWVISTFTVVYISMIQPFINIWLSSDYRLSFLSSILIGINFYCVMMNVPAVSVQNALGLHYHDRNASIGYAIFAIVISIILGTNYGIPGVVSANIISILLFPTITKPYVIFKNVFHVSPLKYYFNYFKRFLLLIIMALGTVYTANLIFLSGSIFNFIIRGFFSFIIPTIILLILYARNDAFEYYLSLARHYMNRK